MQRSSPIVLCCIISVSIASARLLGTHSANKSQQTLGLVAQPCEGLGTWYSTTDVQTQCWDDFPTKSTGTWFVEFYQPWCSYCQDFKEYWTYLASPAAKTPGAVAAVDCSLNKKLCESWGIDAYPTTKALHNGVWSDGPYDLSVVKLQAWTHRVVSGSTGLHERKDHGAAGGRRDHEDVARDDDYDYKELQRALEAELGMEDYMLAKKTGHDYYSSGRLIAGSKPPPTRCLLADAPVLPCPMPDDLKGLLNTDGHKC